MNIRQIWVALVVLALAALACGGGTEPTATPLPRPTQKPLATATKAAAKPTATKSSAKPTATEAEAQPTAEGGSPIVLSDTPFAHKSGAFTVTLPQDYDVNEKANSVFVTSPDKVVAIEISFTNVGQALTADQLNVYITAVEQNWFATFADYTPGNFETQNDGSIGVFKTLTSGTPQTVFSYYWQDQATVYEQDFWVDTDQYDTYVQGLLDVANSMTTDATAGAAVDPYAIVYTFTDAQKLFAFDIPYAWTYEKSTADNTVVDTFTSPDKLSYIENISYDNGTAVTKTDAGAFARTLLEEYYKVTDLKVTNDKVQSDGSERLTWNSPALNIDGESFFETRGTTFLLLTWIVDTPAYDILVPIWSNVVKTYTIPS